MVKIGLTGSFGTGKTFVASIFRSLGAMVIDADRIAHEVIRKNSPAYKKIIRVFGKGILNKSGDIDRRELAKKVFDKKKKVDKLNRIVHPEVIKRIKERARKTRDNKLIVIDAPLLIEADLAGLVDKLVVVKASQEKQISRCMSKFDITKEECLERIDCQMPLARKIAMADFVIDNDGTRFETRRQVKEIWKKISRIKRGNIWR